MKIAVSNCFVLKIFFFKLLAKKVRTYWHVVHIVPLGAMHSLTFSKTSDRRPNAITQVEGFLFKTMGSVLFKKL